ncbi:tryptophan--tRNA ligase [Candidatus Mycoplasma mahonii]|uniref:tryptophan--tRNA ligase n=1 Tax=Candidatus Mycoplasma mahonii TaxID=3004105 RepID=UPI0026EDF8AB|nr:tryptophan--tRNA ligase [Candidatus Mycoplasma mahonii]WKX02712.1 tryptophan--tRNA ligase [Candidatus Mycoplasma mahonii]
MKKRMVSGIQATGILTIGNYIGAIQKFIELQDNNEMFIFVADLHALSIDIHPQTLRENRKNIVATYLAAGLDPIKTTIYYQSSLAEHSQLLWILENQTTIGELSRMTQFKDKVQKSNSKNGTTKIKAGLLTYPALMAADILLYNPDYVPVGEDQRQHLELVRSIAIRFNNRYGDVFKIPAPQIAKEGAKIMSLTDPNKKMSKSSPSKKSFISLNDSPDEARKKIMKSATDSEEKVYISNEKPGIRNLLTIYSSLEGISIIDAADKFKDDNYKDFKNAVANVVCEFLIDLQSRFEESLKLVDKITEEGRIKAKLVAQETIKIVNNKIGL